MPACSSTAWSTKTAPSWPTYPSPRSASTPRCPAASSGSRCTTPRRRSWPRCRPSSGCIRWPWRTPTTATSGRRSRNTAIRSSSSCTCSERASASPARCTVGEVDVFVGRNYVVSVRNRSEHGFTEVRERCEREPELLQQRPGLRALRADGCGGRPLLSGHRCLRGRTRNHRAAHLHQGRRAREHQAPLRTEAALDAAQACRRAAARRHQQAARRARAADLRRLAGILPRRGRPPEPHQRHPSTRSATPSAPRSTSTCRWSPSRTAR